MRKNKHINRYCVDCGTDVSRCAERCTKCRGKQEYFHTKASSVNPKYTEPRGSKMRKVLGLKPTEFGMSRGYGLDIV